MNHGEIVSFLWGVADLIRDTFKRGKYQDVVLPLTVLRRLDCVLAPTKAKVLETQSRLREKKLENLDPQLRKASGFAFYNTSRYDFDKLMGDAPHLAANLRNYIAGFSPNMREVLEKFDFDNTISKLDEAGLLFQVMDRFKSVDLHPDKVDNPTMGMIFEELIRKFNEAMNENPGEHFTPRDVVHLMVDLLLAGDEDRICKKGVVLSVCDPCCGSGGMLTITKEHITVGVRKNGTLIRPAINSAADIHLFGQEVNPETFAVCKSDLFMKSTDGRDAEHIFFGSTLSNDRHGGDSFDYLIANPPYGKDWKRDEEAVRAEHDRGSAGRFGPGLPRISERSFEEAIECGLLEHGPDACDGDSMAVREATPPYGDAVPGGYRKRSPGDYDCSLCLIPRDVLDFILATQPKEWEKLKQHHAAEVKERFLTRLSQEIGRRGALDVLRNGIKDSGCKFRLAYFRPSSGLNEELRRLHAANLFAVVRQLRCSEKNKNSLDLALFLNGIPIFTAELKNPLTGQTVQDAIKQYKTDRDPREPLLAFGRCLAHFAVDPELVFVTTHLDGPRTSFLPLNQGKFGGAGNPPVPPTQKGYATAYLWENIWARDSVLDLIRQFIHEVEEEDDKGRKTGRRFLIFPRYQQLDAVRRLVTDARELGAGQRYLIQHSAGSGKSFTIAWLAHQLSILHDARDHRVFDSIVVVTDRRVLDRQLQSTMRQFEQTLGVVENIDTTSRQLKQALESGKTIIVTTLQKFPVIAQEIGELPGKRFAVIVDEAHSSQSGESTKSLKSVLGSTTLEEAERDEAGSETPEEELENAILAEMQERGRLPNLSMFAFTATPKPKTLELFGIRRMDGKFEPFHLYSMRQAIEEGFILDILENYTTYKTYWRLLKTIENDPRYDKNKASFLLRSFVDLHPHAIQEKVRILVEHFAAQVQDQIGGKAKAMIVTRSRLHAVRYKLAVDRYLAERGYPFKTLVAFSGTVQDRGHSYTESGMNSAGKGRTIGERQTAKEFENSEYRFLIVANKFQTGFDQPLLHTMYVDKKLGGVNAVQTLSRLNRTHHPDKRGTMVLDFANEADEIRKAFEPYYETTLLSEATDPNLLYETQSRLLAFGVYTEADVDAFARVYFDRKATQDQLYAALAPIVGRFGGVTPEEQHHLRGQLTDYVRLYAFLAQVLTFVDADLERLYVFARHLRRLLPAERAELPREVQQNIDMESYRLQQTGSGKILLDRRAGQLDPMRTKDHHGPSPDELEPLSRIIAELNDRFGLNLGPEHRVTLGQMIEKLDGDVALDASARVNTRENVRLAFDQKVEDVIQEIVDSNFELYRRITDDRAFGQAIKNFLFDQYLRGHRQAEELLKQRESKTLEFKSTLRWNLRENKKDPQVVTHAVLKTIAAFLNTEGGDLLIGVADDRSIVGIEPDGFENEDRFLLHLSHVVQSGLGDRTGTCIDPNLQVVQGKTVCLVSCRRSPEPVFLRWKGTEEHPEGDFYVRSGPGTVKLAPESAQVYIRTRFPQIAPHTSERT